MRKMLALLVLLFVLSAAAHGEGTPLTMKVDIPATARVIDHINGENTGFHFPGGTPVLAMYFAPVIDADAMILRCGGETIMIDCGSQAMIKRTVGFLRQLGITEIDAIINTHPHYDHLDGLEAIARVAKVKELRICFPADENETMVKAMAVCQKYDIPVTAFGDGDVWQVGGAEIIVWRREDPSWGLNDKSAVLRVQFGERTALLTADADFYAQARLAETVPAEMLDADILKYPHHGLASMDPNFAEMVSPAFAIITNQEIERTANAQWHLGQLGTPYAFTLKGPIVAMTDGETWLVERMPIDPATIN